MLFPNTSEIFSVTIISSLFPAICSRLRDVIIGISILVAMRVRAIFSLSALVVLAVNTNTRTHSCVVMRWSVGRLDASACGDDRP